MRGESLSQDALLERLKEAPTGRRTVVAIAGAPGAGKSTLAAALAEALNAGMPDRAAVLPMDGYHYDDTLLSARGLLPRKGAPQTFDVAGLAHMLARLRRNEEPEIAVPVFDRDIEIARAGARMIPQAVDILLVEGNYLLVGEAPWNMLRKSFDLTVFIDVPEPVLRERLIARWRGYDMSPEGIRSKLDDNDLPNGRFVREKSVDPDLVLRQDMGGGRDG